MVVFKTYNESSYTVINMELKELYDKNIDLAFQPFINYNHLDEGYHDN